MSGKKLLSLLHLPLDLSLSPEIETEIARRAKHAGVRSIHADWLAELGGPWRAALSSLVLSGKLEVVDGPENQLDGTHSRSELRETAQHLFLASWKLSPWQNPPSEIDLKRVEGAAIAMSAQDQNQLAFSVLKWGELCLHLRQAGFADLASRLFAQTQCLDAWLSPLVKQSDWLEPTFRSFRLLGGAKPDSLIGCARRSDTGELSIASIRAAEARLLDQLLEQDPDENRSELIEQLQRDHTEAFASLIRLGWVAPTEIRPKGPSNRA